jgi:hypothetical protein
MLHPDKTRFVDFRNTVSNGTTHPETNGTTFTFLGFTHIWGKSRAGKTVVRQVGLAAGRVASRLASCAATAPPEAIILAHGFLIDMMFDPEPISRVRSN